MDIISFSEAATANSRIEKINANPDSSSGIVTVPKTIASGETITIPAGRVAILPNVQIDGVLNVDGEVFIPSGATLGDLDAQLALKADTSYVNNKLALKANTADLKEIGVGQTWQNVTASRDLGVTYTNSTGKPVFIQVSIYITADGLWRATVAGVIVSDVQANAGYDDYVNFSFIVPNGSTYSVTQLSGSYLAMLWSELR